MVAPMSLANDLRKLRKNYEQKGYFKLSPLQLLAEFSLCLILYVGGFLIYPDYPLSGIALQLVAAITIVWSIHDIGHGAFFKSNQLNRWLSEILGLWILGMPQMEYHFNIHRKHHSFTNILDKDLALNTGFIAWHENQIDRRFKSLYPLQSFIWIFFVLPLTYPILTLQCSLLLVKNKEWSRLILLVSRWILFTFIYWNSLTLLFIPPLITGFILGLSASLNHFHLPISKGFNSKYPEKVFRTTQNLNSKSFFARWITGGLNSHIEHHLFPTMPSRNLHLISEDIAQLAEKHDLNYHSSSFCSCILNLWNKLESIKKVNSRGSLYENI